jgi:hypothetical protein
MISAMWVRRLGMILIILSFSFPAKPDATYSVKFTQDADGLFVVYSFEEPIVKFLFKTQPHKFRTESWLPHSQAGEFFNEKGVQGFALEVPTKKIEFNVSINNDFIRGQYTPFLIFSDNSYFFYTGHYLLSSYFSLEVPNKPVKLKAHELLVDDKNNKQTVLLLNNGKNLDVGHFYTSTSRIHEESETGTRVIDPKLPIWISEVIEEYSSLVFDFYSSLFDSQKESDFDLIVSFDDRNVAPRSDGSVINDQIVLSFVGSNWSMYPEKNKENVLRLMFHEYAHLFIRTKNEKSSSWITEGTAEYLAILSLLELGVISEVKFNLIFTEYFQSCYLSLSKSPLIEFEKANKRKESYHCGSVIQLMLSRMKSPQPKMILQTFEKIVNSPQQSAETLNRSLVDNLVKDGMEENYSYLLRDIIFAKLAERHTKLLELLDNVDIRYDMEFTSKHKSHLFQLALQRFMNAHCGRFSFWTEETFYKTEAIETCKGFEKEMDIIGFGGMSMFDETALAYDYLYSKCKARDEVQVDLLNSIRKPTLYCIEEIPLRQLPIIITRSFSILKKRTNH